MLDYFTKADKGLDIVLRWVGAFTLVSAMLSWLAKQVTWLGNLNWAEAIFVGLTAACVLSVVLSLAMIAFRIFRPLPKPEAEQSPTGSDYVGEVQTIRVKIESLEAEISKSTEQLRKQGQDTRKLDSKVETIAVLSNKLSEGTSEWQGLQSDNIKTLFERVAELKAASDASAKQAKEIIAFGDNQARKLGDLQTNVQAIRHGCAKLDDTFKAHSEQVREALRTQYLREITGKFEQNLIECHDKMYLPLKGGEVLEADDWSEWEKLHAEWRRYLDRWIEYSRWYSDEDLKAVILTTPDSSYGANWSVEESQLPGAEAVRKFKQFRIQHTQWEQQLDTVKSNMIGVAYNGTRRSNISDG